MQCLSCFESKPAAPLCPHCGWDASQPREPHALPAGYRLRRGQYLIGRVLGKPGGFGIAYKAFDEKRRAVVVVKECLLTSSGHVGREPDGVRIAVNPGFASAYRRWIERFLAEGALIQRFTHPSIVRVVDIFEANGTAYYVMPFVEGEDLARWCARHGGRLPADAVARMARQLLDALAQIHEAGFIHRDIKPSNVLITLRRRKPVLIDFGAARDDFTDERSRSHIAAHTPTYAPIEQVTASSEQGPWTDLYSLCATLHFALLGKTTLPSEKRELARPDPYVPVGRLLPGLDPRLAQLIDRGLALRPQQRLRNTAEALALLGPADDEGASDLRPPPPPPPPPTPPPLPAVIGLLPAGVALLMAVVSEDPGDALLGWPGAVIALNGVLWGVWTLHRRRRSSVSGQAGGRTSPAPLTSGGSSTAGPASEHGTDGDTLPALELVLRSPSALVMRRTLRAGETLVVGRTVRADFAVANDWLSGRHAEITVLPDGRFRLRDLGSTNHTYLLVRPPTGGAGAWQQVNGAEGHEARFMLGPPDGGVQLDLRPTRVPA